MIEAALDTSTSYFCFSLAKDKKIIIDEVWENNNRSSEILPQIQKSLTSHNYSFNEINNWLVGIGPGSFTGIRIGIAFVQGLCYGSESKIFGINSGNLLLQDEIKNDTYVLHDGRRQEVIVNQFNQKQQEIEPYVLEIKKLEQIIKPNHIIKTALPYEKLNSLPKELLDKIEFCSINGCSHFFQSKVKRISSTEPIYVRPAVFTNSN